MTTRTTHVSALTVAKRSEGNMIRHSTWLDSFHTFLLAGRTSAGAAGRKVMLVVLVVGFAPMIYGLLRSAATTESPERQMLARVDAAGGAWNVSAAVVMQDLNDTTLDLEGFGARTAMARTDMRSVVDRMETAIEPTDTSPLAVAIRALVATYRTKIDVLDAIAEAAANNDNAQVRSALQRWQEADKRRVGALAVFIIAARPYLSPEELALFQKAAT